MELCGSESNLGASKTIATLLDMEVRLQPHLSALENARNAVARYWRWLGTVVVCLIAVGLCAHILLGSNGAVAYRQKKSDYRALQKDIDDLNKENSELQTRVKELQSDPEAIEKEAREQLRYAKPGEVIYMMPEQPASKSPASASAGNTAKP